MAREKAFRRAKKKKSIYPNIQEEVNTIMYHGIDTRTYTYTYTVRIH